MTRSGYQLVGYIAWQGGRWYLRHRYGHLVPSRRVVAAGIVGVGVTALLVAQRRGATG